MAFGKMFWVGALWGLGSITLLLAALYGARVLSVGELALHGLRALKFAVFWAGFFLIVGWYEEFLLRGYTQFTLTRLIGFWPAAVALSCVFSLIHLGNAGEQWPGLLAVFVIGFFFCLTLRRWAFMRPGIGGRLLFIPCRIVERFFQGIFCRHRCMGRGGLPAGWWGRRGVCCALW
jgi:membrane protease YdiL (CAAX protease family)